MPGDVGPTVAATRTSFEILEKLHRLEGAGVTVVADAIDMPKSTAHKHLRTLVSLGYVVQRGDVYDLDVTLYGFSSYVAERHPLLAVSQPQVERLAATTKQMAGLYVVRAGRGFDIHREGDEHASAGPLPRDLHCTAPGKAILAELPDPVVDDVIDEFGLPALTSETITDRDALDEERSRIQDRGIAFDREESQEGVRGVAVPISGEDGVVGSLYVVGDADELAGKWFDENTPGIVVSCVNTVEQQLRH